MRTELFGLCLLLLAGCGEGDVRPSGRQGVYPALNESPPPPLLPASRFPGQSAAAPASRAPASEASEDGLVPLVQRKEEQLLRLREYAANAETNDPFALTEQEIEDLSKLEDLSIH